MSDGPMRQSNNRGGFKYQSEPEPKSKADPLQALEALVETLRTEASKAGHWKDERFARTYQWFADEFEPIVQQLKEEQDDYTLARLERAVRALRVAGEAKHELEERIAMQRKRIQQLEQSNIDLRRNAERGFTHEPIEVQAKINALDQGKAIVVEQNRELRLSLAALEEERERLWVVLRYISKPTVGQQEDADRRTIALALETCIRLARAALSSSGSHEGPVVLGPKASARLDDIMANPSGELPDPPLSSSGAEPCAIENPGVWHRCAVHSGSETE